MAKHDSKLRFAVGAPEGRRSSTWSLWTYSSRSRTNERTDVYLAPRSVAGALKLSLHASGDWRLGFTDQFVKSAAAKGGNWPRPIVQARMPPARRGIVEAAHIVVPESELRQLGDTPGLDVNWVSAPPVGHHVDFIVAITTSDAPMQRWPGNGVSILGEFPLRADERLWLLYRIQVDSERHRSEFERTKRHARLRSELEESETFRLTAYATMDQVEQPFVMYDLAF